MKPLPLNPWFPFRITQKNTPQITRECFFYQRKLEGVLWTTKCIECFLFNLSVLPSRIECWFQLQIQGEFFFSLLLRSVPWLAKFALILALPLARGNILPHISCTIPPNQVLLSIIGEIRTNWELIRLPSYQLRLFCLREFPSKGVRILRWHDQYHPL